jgi:xylulokinase
MDYLMGIDLGSTSLKAIVYDADGNQVAVGSRPTQRFHPEPKHPEWTVWQPEQIWGDTAAAVQDAVAQLDQPTVQAVAVTGMGMDGLPVDAEGKWLYPFISWHDPRTGPQLQWWKDKIGVERQFAIGGNPLWPINSALRIRWMMDNEPDIIARTDKWLLIEDFLNFMLCGRQVTDYSMASCTLLFDQAQRSWSDELIRDSGIDRNILCEIQPSGTLIGEVHRAAAEATGLPEGTPVVLGGHDHLCGALPVGAFSPGVVLDVTGTWETVVTSTATPILNDLLRAAGMTVQAHVARDIHTVWGGNVAGEMVEWHRRQLANGEAWDTLIAEASASSPGAGGVMFLPHMSGASSPVVDPESLGAFAGLNPRTNRGDLLRAIIEGLDYQFLDIVTAMESAMGSRLQRFVAVGGATRNAFWMQNKADVVGRPVETSEIEEATPLGAAILAGIGIGVYQDKSEAYQRVNRPAKVFEPNPEVAGNYAELFSTYRELYAATKTINHTLFRKFLT